MSERGIRNWIGLSLVLIGVCLFAFIFNGSISGDSDRAGYRPYTKFEIKERFPGPYSNIEIGELARPAFSTGVDAESKADPAILSHNESGHRYGETSAAAFKQPSADLVDGLSSNYLTSFQDLPAMEPDLETKVVEDSTQI